MNKASYVKLKIHLNQGRISGGFEWVQLSKMVVGHYRSSGGTSSDQWDSSLNTLFLKPHESISLQNDQLDF